MNSYYHLALDIVTIASMSLGVVFFVGTAVGIVRFPDFFTRMHAASKGDTLSGLLLLFGVAVWQLHEPNLMNVLVSVKVIFISVFILATSPTAGHALTEAAFATGAQPWGKGPNDEAPTEVLGEVNNDTEVSP